MIKLKNIFFIIFISSVLFNFGSIVKAQADQATQKESHASAYLIGPNDILTIYVWKEPELTQDVTVMPDGRIVFPMIGEIMAKGKTVMELKNIITKKLKDYVNSPVVTVIVKASNSRIIYTIGKLNKPGPYPLAPNMTVLQALSAAGSFTEWADTKNIIVVRRKGANEVMFRFNYQEFISGKNLGQNILLKPGDTIVVP